MCGEDATAYYAMAHAKGSLQGLPIKGSCDPRAEPLSREGRIRVYSRLQPCFLCTPVSSSRVQAFEEACRSCFDPYRGFNGSCLSSSKLYIPKLNRNSDRLPGTGIHGAKRLGRCRLPGLHHLPAHDAPGLPDADEPTYAGPRYTGVVGLRFSATAAAPHVTIWSYIACSCQGDAVLPVALCTGFIRRIACSAGPSEPSLSRAALATC